MVVVDAFSDDGAWEFFKEHAQGDPRIRVSQAPRQGIYPGINACLEQARGDYVYIATSDDTMAPDCLEKMFDALEKHSECDLAHCPLRTIDKAGKELDTGWAQHSLFARSSGRYLNSPHLRKAPFDGLLHLVGESVYISLTQLLIRRSLFERVGLFDGRWGSVGDFNWNMRASLVTDTVHVPETWASWRIHPSQATDQNGADKTIHWRKVEEMIDHALGCSKAKMSINLERVLRNGRRSYFAQRRDFETNLRAHATRLERLKYLVRHLRQGSPYAWHYAGQRALGKSKWQCPSLITHWLRAENPSPCLVHL
ncbi:MAG: glycosyl transferase family 2 [Verrucomicrobiales bacterium]|nr:glycosyl transferase family 2 [Verrucomicrobiales bacterium]